MHALSRVVLLALTLALALPLSADPNDIFVDATSFAGIRGQTSATLSHTVGTGTNRYLVVGISIANSQTVSSVTYSGVPLTLVGRQATASNNESIEIWQMIAPPSGTANLAVTLTGVADFVVGAISFNGVHQTVPHGGFVSAMGQGTTATVNVASGSREMVFDVVGTAGGAHPITPGAAQTQQWNLRTGNGAGDNVGGGSTTPSAFGTNIGGVNTVQPSWTLDKSRRWAIGAISIRPAVAPTAVSRVRGSFVRCGDAVEVRWSSSFETNNVGFRVVREEADGRMAALPQLVAGSLFGTFARDYRWIDRNARAARYWIEDVDAKGRTRLHGPLLEEEGTCMASGAPPSPTIAGLGRPRVARLATNARQPIGNDAATAKRIAAGPALKISVDREGWYRIARPAGSDARKLQLYADGVEHAIRVDGDFVELYATGQDTPWSASRTYWLVEGHGPGKRIKTIDAPASSTTLRSYPYSVERHDRNIYAAEIRNGEADNFFGPVVSDWTATQTLTLPHVDPHGEAALRIVIQGVTGEHRVAVTVNGRAAGTIAFLPTERATRTLTFPSSWLVSGDNEIALTSGAPDQLSAIESVRITYPRTYDADGDSLLFSAPGGQPVVLRGFTSARVFDTTDPANVVEIRGTSFVAPGTGTRTFLAVTAPSAPLAIAANVPSDWASKKNEGSVVILTTRALAPPLEPLRAHRAAQYGSAVVVDVEDLYDEFASGNKTPFAIRDFVLASRDWKQPPRFFLLAGDASFDPRNYLGLGNDDAIPTKLVDTAYLETSSDDWFTDLDGDGAADIPIGRLAVRTPSEAAAVVAKILGYETQSDASWARRAIAVTDVDPEIPFDEYARSTMSILQEAYSVTHVRASVAAELAAGPGLVVYYGHGSTGQWSSRRLLSTDDVPLLQNDPRLPFVMGMTCLNAFFHDVYSSSLGEALVHAPAGGAIAVWTSSGLTLPGDQVRMANAMARSLTSGAPAIGDAIVAAKKDIADRDVKTTWILLGDPAMKLRTPSRR